MDIRVSAIHFESTQGPHKSLDTNECSSLSQLDQILEKPTNTIKNSAGRQLFIAEAPLSSPSFVRFRTLMHDRLGVPDDVFERHRWSHTTFQFDETINCPRLPTVNRPRRMFTLEYFELWQVLGESHAIFESQTPIIAKCAVTGRDFQCYRWKSPNRGWLLIVPRRCSFWSRQSADGWTGK